MFKRGLLSVWVGILILSGMFLLGQESWPPQTDPCDPDPCEVIENATAGTCTPVDTTDFTCECEPGYDWQDGTKTCEADPCDPDPCDGIGYAILGTCLPVGTTDFTCECEPGYDWQDDTNSCQDDPCDPDPCEGIGYAILGTCLPVGTTDFTCECETGYAWQEATNTCEEPVPGCVDHDEDGYYAFDPVYCPEGNDCDDTRANVNPGEIEAPFGDPVCSDTLDNDCDGDADGDDMECLLLYLDPPANVDATDVVIDPSYDPMLNANFNDRVNILWDFVTGATDYEVFRADEPAGTYSFLGAVTDPVTSYDDTQAETLVLPEAPSGADVDDPLYVAWEDTVRTLLNAFKDFHYYKIKAFNPVAESDFSGEEEGRIDYTNAEFFDIFSALGGIALSKVLFLAGDIGIGSTGNWTLYDECGVGSVNFDLASGNVITFTFDDYMDSLDYDSLSGIDCSGNRTVISNGVIYGDLNFLGIGTLTGTIFLSGDTAAEVYLEIPMSFGEPQDGTADVKYNGEEVTGYVFEM